MVAARLEGDVPRIGDNGLIYNRLKYKLLALACIFASTAAAQLGDYMGPGILTQGAGDIGTRAGQPVALRLYADVNAVYDNGLQPLALTSTGNLAQVNGLYGVEADIGAYGVHQWRQAQLGLDYRGSFRDYTNGGYYDGSDQHLALGYTYQESRRLYFDLQEVAGTLSRSIGGIPGVNLPIPTVVDQPTSLLFDDREYYTESSVGVTYQLSARTSVTAGGSGFLVHQQNAGLIGVDGYNLRGGIHHRMSRSTTIGAEYSHQDYSYPGEYGQSTINSYTGVYAAQLGPLWTFSLQGGVYQAEVQGIQEVALTSTIAAILGISNVAQTFYRAYTFPTGAARLTRKFKNSILALSYSQSVTPGNGVYLTSRTSSGTASYSYTGIRKTSLTISGGEYELSSLGQSLERYQQVSGGAGMSYAVYKALHLIARYDARHQEIDLAGYRRTSYRATIGIAFSPGSVPLALW
jgi:hypothetical protein